ncbi:FAD binding domain protein [Mycobacterium xenopi 3993]|nr:FAD binding domain protein [Mycobacterium xenopi 3993]
MLHKKPEWVRPIGTPVGAIDLRGSTAGFTLGGLMTTLDSEVLHVGGEPIPGLYAAGRCTAGLAAWVMPAGSRWAMAASMGVAPVVPPPRAESFQHSSRSAPSMRCVGPASVPPM